MNSLEWIDKQILLVKENIQYHKNLLTESEEEYVGEIISAIKLLEPKLNILQQIKTELEAWEAVRPRLKITGAFLEMRFITKDHTSYRVIEKALEVKDNA